MYCKISSDLPVPARPMISVLEPAHETTTQQAVERIDTAAHDLAGKAATMFGRHQTREQLHAAGSNDEIMIAAAEGLPSALDNNAQAPPLAAINRRQLVQVDHAMGNAVDRPIGTLDRQIVEQDHGRLVSSEIVLEG